ncbi:MAG: SRPBCC family protein [Bacteroidetes bacterium]|nr:SRPBCC family protein [Bacteroidota bacterium]
MKQISPIHHINKPIEEVFDTISNITLFAEHHPLMRKAECVGENKYVMYENMKLFQGVMIPFSYNAEITQLEKNRKVEIVAKPNFLMSILLSFSFIELKGKTEVRELVTVKGPWPFSTILINLIRTTHLQLIESIRKS